MRFYLNSFQLRKELVPHEVDLLHEEGNHVMFIVYRGYLDLWSDNANTGLAIDGDHSIVACCSVDKLLSALREIEEQTITLDLHEFGGSALYASLLLDEDKPGRTDITRYI